MAVSQLVNNTGVKPIGDQVLVRRVPADRNAGLIQLPDGAELWRNEGTVLAVGRRVKAKEIRPDVQILFKSRPSSALIRDSREPDQRREWEGVIVLREEDILCILETRS